MQLGMIGLGRMGANMVRRILAAGHACVVHDIHSEAVESLAREGAIGATLLEDFVARLDRPRHVWMMVPAAVVDSTLSAIVPLLERDDALIDGGNSFYRDDIRRGGELTPKGIHYLDVGTSGGVWGLKRGYCLMIGGDEAAVRRLDPIFAALAPASPPRPHAGPRARPAARPSRATCTAAPAAPATSSRWSTTASNTA